MDEPFRVLITDEEMPVDNSAVKNMEQINPAFRVINAARNVSEAVILAEQLLPQVVFVSLQKPVDDEMAQLSAFCETFPGIRLVILCKPDTCAYVRNVLQNKVYLYLLSPVTPDDLRITLERLAEQLIADKPSPLLESAQGANDIVLRVQAYLKDNYTQAVNFSAVARQFGLSGSHLARIFREETGISQQKFLAQCRIAFAKRLLAGTRLSVQEVGVRVGYPDPFHFSKVFKQYENVSPVQFRKSLTVAHGS